MPVLSVVKEDKTVRTEELVEKGLSQPFFPKKEKFCVEYTQFLVITNPDSRNLISTGCDRTVPLSIQKCKLNDYTADHTATTMHLGIKR